MSQYTVKCIGYGKDKFLKSINDTSNPLMSKLKWSTDINDCEGISFDDAILLKVKLNLNIATLHSDKSPYMDQGVIKGVFFTILELDK